MRIKALTTAALAILVSLALLGGCGDDDGNGEASGASDGSVSSQEQFVNEANETCEEFRERIQKEVQKALEAKPKEQPSPQQLGNEVVAPAFEEQARELRALQPPPNDTKQVEKIADSIRGIADTIRNDLSSYTTGPGGRLTKEAEQLAGAYGLTSCGRL